MLHIVTIVMFTNFANELGPHPVGYHWFHPQASPAAVAQMTSFTSADRLTRRPSAWLVGKMCGWHMLYGTGMHRIHE